jgi:hypothetical protein
MDVLTTHDSHVISFTSSDATSVDSVYGNAKFTCQMTNVNRGGTHAIKLVPSKILVPNVFFNVLPGKSQTVLKRPSDVAPALSVNTSVTPGFYTVQRLLAVLNGIYSTYVIFSYDVVTERVEVKAIVDGNGDRSITVSKELALILGFSNWAVPSVVTGAHPVPADGKSVELSEGEISVAARSPSMGTTPIVHIIARKASTQNLLSSNSSEYSVLASVPMTGASYGQYATYTAPDIFVDDIDFRAERTLSNMDFELVDHRFEQLTIDPRFPVVIQLKVFHTDTKR